MLADARARPIRRIDASHRPAPACSPRAACLDGGRRPAARPAVLQASGSCSQARRSARPPPGTQSLGRGRLVAVLDTGHRPARPRARRRAVDATPASAPATASTTTATATSTTSTASTRSRGSGDPTDDNGHGTHGRRRDRRTRRQSRRRARGWRRTRRSSRSRCSTPSMRGDTGCARGRHPLRDRGRRQASSRRRLNSDGRSRALDAAIAELGPGRRARSSPPPATSSRNLDLRPSWPAAYPHDEVVAVAARERNGAARGRSPTAGCGRSTSPRPARGSLGPGTGAVLSSSGAARRWRPRTSPPRSR